MASATGAIVLCIVLGCAVCSSAKAEQTRTLYIDDDLFSGMAHDADYTGGIAIAFGNDLTLESDSARRWLARFDRAFGIDSADHRYEIEVGAAAFTPRNISSFDVVPGDRPYAGLVYASAALIQSQNDGRSAVTTLAAGFLGLEFVPSVQRGIHRTMGSVPPQGWQHQVSDGGEATLRLAHEQKLAGPIVDFAGGRAQWLYRAGVGVGFLTDVNVGVAARFGRFSDARWGLHTSPTGLSDRAAFDHTDRDDRFLYATLSARVPIYNAFLQGQFRDSDYTVPSSRRRYFIPDVSLGFVLGLPKDRDLHYFVRAQRSDVRLAERSETVVYAGISLSW